MSVMFLGPTTTFTWHVSALALYSRDANQSCDTSVMLGRPRSTLCQHPPTLLAWQLCVCTGASQALMVT